MFPTTYITGFQQMLKQSTTTSTESILLFLCDITSISGQQPFQQHVIVPRGFMDFVYGNLHNCFPTDAKYVNSLLKLSDKR
jgi:hypothetical protein